ncbi:hypothetical protein GQ600_20236 [Phytophthora cactorum]|nr:hypothetical protein GQ600_20236 [Phytophthora cactorum]
MYKSALDPSGSLEFAFDPLRALHAHEDSRLQWPEYPYKQVTIDRVRSKAGRSSIDGNELSEESAAGALLMAAVKRLGQCFTLSSTIEKTKTIEPGDSKAARERAQQEQDELAAWGARQIVKRYEDGSKYDGDGVTENDVTTPHGYGTLWVPEEKYTSSVGGLLISNEWFDMLASGKLISNTSGFDMLASGKMASCMAMACTIGLRASRGKGIHS